MFKIVGHLIVFVLLTALTQVGGIVYLTVLYWGNKKGLSRFKFGVLFVSVYLMVSMLVLPIVAPFFGRRPLSVFGVLTPVSYFTCFLNRHYVSADLFDVLVKISKQYHDEFDTEIHYLDANFPLFDGFPLFPHLSHNDGKKVDLAFSYNDERGERTSEVPSWFGYGVFDKPRSEEVNYAQICEQKGCWQYGVLGFIAGTNDKYVVDIKRTSWIVKEAVEIPEVSKIFIEPHLKIRWSLGRYGKVRFHGCQAVRHDDHIHLEVK